MSKRAGKNLRRAVTVAVVALVAVASWWQHSRYIHEITRLEDIGSRVGRRVENAERAATRLSQLRHETEEFDASNAAQLRAVPTSLDVESFIATLEEWAAGFSVSLEKHRVEANAVSLFSCDVCDRATLSLKFSGTRRAIEAMFHRRDTLERFVQWRKLDTAEDWADAELTIFSRENTPGHDRNPCTEEASPAPLSRFWPLSRAVARERTRVEKLCEELTRLRSVDDQVEEYTAKFEQNEEWAYILRQLESIAEDEEVAIRAMPPEARSKLDPPS